MSYPNFSYYNGPSTTQSFWSPTPPSTFGTVAKTGQPKPRSGWPASTYTPPSLSHPSPGQPITQPSGYVNSMILPSETPSPRHEVLQGKVTQLFSNFGYINDDIIFSICDVMGPMVKVGDKVAVDATFQPNNPTKYKGERVCKIDETRLNSSVTSGYGKMKTLSQGTPARIEIPLKNRLGDKYDMDEPCKRQEVPHMKTRLGDKYDSEESSSRSEMPIKNRLGNKFKSSQQTEEKASYKRPETIKEKRNSMKNRLSENASSSKHNSSSNDIISKVTPKKVVAHKPEIAVKRKAVSPIRPKKVVKAPSPVKRKSESVNKYIPRSYENFASCEMDCALVKLQCRSLVPPTEFFHASLKYQNSFPLNHPMKLGNNCHFKILDKKIKCIDSFIDEKLNSEIDPPDADSTFVAKVMLLSTEDLAKFYKDTLTLAEEFESDNNKIPITKSIKFLIGSTGQNKLFGIGGAWSPSLDGVDPETNPRVLINTAIRTCKSITGIDLSNCSSWPKFLELHYYRPSQKLNKVKENNDSVIDLDDLTEEYKEPHMETVTYFIPDVWNCVPSQDNWSETKRLYQEQLTRIMCPPPSQMTLKPMITPHINTTTSTTATLDASSPTTTVPSNGSEKTTADDSQEEEDYNFNETEDVDDKPKNSEEEQQSNNLMEQPTHYSKLIVATMKIVDIKKELELRKLNNRGVMEQLKARLKGALEREENETKNKDPNTAVAVSPVGKRVPEVILSETEKNELKKLYALPDRPEIIVHQNKKLFNNQVKMRVVSLHSLLTYYNVTLQESTFELALFAIQFLEMMRRDAVFTIYKSIVVAPEKDLVNVDESAKKAKLMVTTSKRTVNRPLLFACTLLDREKVNKISLEELKVLIEGLGICLSCNQLSQILGKIKSNNKFFNYRQLTDKEMTDTDILNMMKMDECDDLDYIKELAMGNKALFENSSTEGGTMDIGGSINDEEMERVKNELDKSERCRQFIELKVSQMKEETEKSIGLAQTQAKEILKLKEQLLDYKNKYRSEQDRGDLYKRDLEKLIRQLKDVDKLASNLSKSVSGTLEKYSNESKKERGAKDDINTSRKSAEKNTTERTVNIVPIVFDLTEDTSKVVDIYKDVDDLTMELGSDHEDQNDKKIEEEKKEEKEKEIPTTREEEKKDTEEDLSTEIPATVITAVEDFDLSKPSDYDMIILDETE